jgi:hypothetical protein
VPSELLIAKEQDQIGQHASSTPWDGVAMTETATDLHGARVTLDSLKPISAYASIFFDGVFLLRFAFVEI